MLSAAQVRIMTSSRLHSNVRSFLPSPWCHMRQRGALSCLPMRIRHANERRRQSNSRNQPVPSFPLVQHPMSHPDSMGSCFHMRALSRFPGAGTPLGCVCYHSAEFQEAHLSKRCPSEGASHAQETSQFTKVGRGCHVPHEKEPATRLGPF